MTDRVIGLCFHGVGTPMRDLEPGEEEYWISPDLFCRVLDEVAGDPRVRISFDDGNASDLELGLPALTERGLTATFFALGARLDQPGSLDAGALRQLAAAGMRIGSHGMDHRPWRGLSEEDLHRELVQARDLLRTASGTSVEEAALPLGRYDRRLLTRVRRAGFTRLHTSDRTWARSTAWLQPRYSVRAHDTVDSVRAEMLTAAVRSHRARRAAVIAAKRWR